MDFQTKGMKTVLDWTIKSFQELTITELYDILRLRVAVFVVEQACAYQDLDGIDFRAYHLVGRNSAGELVCYMRIIPAETYRNGCGSIGRVVVVKRFRSKGFAHELLRRGIAAYNELVGKDIPIEIDAQAYLQHFYENYGFKPVGGVFDLDGLPHIKMVNDGPDARRANVCRTEKKIKPNGRFLAEKG